MSNQLRSEKMSQDALRRAYRMHVTKVSDMHLMFEVFPPLNYPVRRPKYSHRTRHHDMIRMVRSLRMKYQVPVRNIEWVGFEPGEEVGGLIPIRSVAQEPAHGKDSAPVESASEVSGQDVVSEVSEAPDDLGIQEPVYLGEEGDRGDAVSESPVDGEDSSEA